MATKSVKEKFKVKEDIWDTDFKEPKIDRDLTIAFSSKHRGSVRLAMGLFYTDEEWKAMRKRVLRTPLP